MRDPKLSPYRNVPTSTLALRLQLGDLSIRDPLQSPASTPITPARTMSILNDLTPTASILLFTPVITPASTVSSKSSSSSSSTPMNPFEILGRALAANHPRIRHVPYIPAMGFTSTHPAFLGQADAVIVVVCETQSSRKESLRCQFAFAEKTREDSETPPVLIRCGDFDGIRGPKDVFPIVMQSGRLDEEVAKGISMKLFGRR